MEEENGPNPTADDDLSQTPVKSCALCGCSTPAVRCDRCGSQTFCLSCDDMYHKHPKRRLHLRKAVDSIWNSARSPRLRRRTELPGDPSKIPIPPPRSRKKERHTIGGRVFLKPHHELGSFGHSKVDMRTISPHNKDIFAGQKSQMRDEATYENDSNFHTSGIEGAAKVNDFYENENVNQGENVDNSRVIARSPWDIQRTNISSPIQVSIPSNSPDMMTNGQSFGYPTKPQSRSITDLTGAPPNPIGHHPYHYPHYPYMHPPVHPSYSHSMSHLNCAQCMTSPWSNVMSPHPSPYFHPMPWGSAQSSLTRTTAPVNNQMPMKHSHGNLAYLDSNFHYPYPAPPFYANGAPVVNSNYPHEIPQQRDESPKMKKSSPKQTLSPEAPVTSENVTPEPSRNDGNAASASEVKYEVEAPPPVPKPPSEPWSCSHCTYINPPGIHVCEVCCKTSYGNQTSARSEEDNDPVIDRRFSDSPDLVNLDALPKSPDYTNKAQKNGFFTEDMDMEDATPTETLPVATPEFTMLTTETQTSTTTKSTDVQTQNLICKSMASSTDSIFPRQETSVQTDTAATAKNCSVATDPMISSQSMESLLSGMSAPPYHNRRAGWGRGTSYSTQSLYERGRSRSPIPRSLSMYNEAHGFGRDSSLPPEEVMQSWNQAWLMTDPMYFKPHVPAMGQPLTREDYYDGTWGSMDKLNRRVKNKQGEKFKSQQRPKLHRSLDDLKAERAQDFIHSRELQFLQTVKEAERCGFSLEDLHVAILHCGRENPVFWLEDNWSSMIKNVIALAAKYGEDNEENDVGVITATEAKEALHIHRGDIWDAVTECIENRQRKILELTVRGNFTQKQIAEALKANEGNVELAFADLLRASTRRHKFILSPGMSEESEDIALYAPADESAAEHAGGTAPKTSKLHLPSDATDRKKSDFLTKLSAIREAQSERRKAREEKEMTRESTSAQEFPDSLEAANSPAEPEEILSKPEETPQEANEEFEDKAPIETESLVIPESVEVKKEEGEDNIPVDYDTNWTDSQGEWIEEYSDEQWDEEADGQWITLQNKYQKMEKEFEEEAMQMAALWEKEELEDEVFEEEAKENPQPIESEAEKQRKEQDEKFQQWVKVNLEKCLSDPEDIEPAEQIVSSDLGIESTMSKSAEFDENIISHSPLQHYPNTLDLSAKVESDWIEVEAEPLEIDVVRTEEVLLEIEREDVLQEPEESDGEWEKIDVDSELADLLQSCRDPHYANDVKTQPDTLISDIEQPEKEFIFEEDLTNTEVNKELSTMEQSELLPEFGDEGEMRVTKEKSPEKTIPRVPTRRRSKVNGAAVEEALRIHSAETTFQPTEDIPPALPLKKKDRSPDKRIPIDLYAVPDKHKTRSPEPVLQVDEKVVEIENNPPPPPQKPPRLNLGFAVEMEEMADEKRFLQVATSKDASPVPSVSNESDSNCFADSESDPDIKEIRQMRQKSLHRKPVKYENTEEDTFEDTFVPVEHEDLRRTVELQSNQDFDNNPELSIPMGTRGHRVSDRVVSPMAFREGSARPLQLFKVTKSEQQSISATTDDKSHNTADASQQKIDVARIPEHQELVLEREAVISNTQMNTDAVAYENQFLPSEVDTSQYYNVTESEMTEKVSPVPQQESALELPEQINVNSELIADAVSDNIPMPFQKQPSVQEEEEFGLGEMEATSAVADYFFGRYNEVTVTRPKKKTTVVRSNKPPATPATKTMSTSEIQSSPATKVQLPMETSASPIIIAPPESHKEEEKPETAVTAAVEIQSPRLQHRPIEVLHEKRIDSLQQQQQEPSAAEYMSFAEDYFFGSYNEVVVPKKLPKKMPQMKIPGMQQPQQKVSAAKPASPKDSPTPQTSTAIIPNQVFSEEMNEGMKRAGSSETLFEEASDIMKHGISTTSLTSDVFYPALEDLSVDQNGDRIYNLDRRVRSVHFEEPQAPVAPPPRRNKLKQEQGIPAIASQGKNGEHYRQYDGSVHMSVLDKKKLPPYSEDFKINQGCDPSNLPSNSILQAVDEQENDISSEISMFTDAESYKLENAPLNSCIVDELSHSFQDVKSDCSPFPESGVEHFIENTSASFSLPSASIDEDIHNHRLFERYIVEKEPKIGELVVVGVDQRPSVYLPLSEAVLYSDVTGCADSVVVDDSSRTQAPSDFQIAEPVNYGKADLETASTIDASNIDTIPPPPYSEDQDVFKLCTEEFGSADGAPSEILDDSLTSISQFCPEKDSVKSQNSVDSRDTNFPDYDEPFASNSHGSRDSNVDELKDVYSVDFDDEYEEGLRLVRETEDLIDELCAIYPPGSFDIDTANEIRNLNKRNNNQDITYDSEQEWKISEQHYNSLNASFIENKAYVDKSANDSKPDNSLIIDTKETLDEIAVAQNTSPDLQPISQVVTDEIKTSDAVLEGHIQSVQNIDVVDSYNVQRLSVLCKAITSPLEIDSSDAGTSQDVRNVSELDTTTMDIPNEAEETSDDSLMPSSHSSVSTQIAVFADTLLQNAIDEFSLNIDNQKEMNVFEGYSNEEIICSTETEIEPEQTSAGGTDSTNQVDDECFYQELTTTQNLDSSGKEIELIPSDEIDFTDSISRDETENISQNQNTEVSTEFGISDKIDDEALFRQVEKLRECSTTQEKHSMFLSEKPHTHAETDSTFDPISSEVEFDNTVIYDKESAEEKITEIEHLLSSSSSHQSSEIAVTPGKIYESDVHHDEIIANDVNLDNITESSDVKPINTTACDVKFSKTSENNLQLGELTKSDIITADNTVIRPPDSRNDKNDAPDPDISTTETSEPNAEEESSLSLMSHFYEEWFEHVMPSVASSVPQPDIRSLYVSYDYSGSSAQSSGNVSENEDMFQSTPAEISHSNINDIGATHAHENTSYEYIENENAVSELMTHEIDDLYITEEDILHSGIIEYTFEKVTDSHERSVQLTPYCEQIQQFVPISNDYQEISIIDSNVNLITGRQEESSVSSTTENTIFSSNKFCQTDDSFEEDQFFDSFDDPSMDAFLMHISIDKGILAEPLKSEIGIQCCLISDESATAVNLYTDVINATSTPNQITEQDASSHVEIISIPCNSKALEDSSICPTTTMSALSKESSNLITTLSSKEESGSETADESSDSDIFLEPYSSQDEVEAHVGSQGRFLYVDVDSDTGFSSGSDCGRKNSKEGLYFQKTTEPSSDTHVVDMEKRSLENIPQGSAPECLTDKGSLNETSTIPSSSPVENLQEETFQELHSLPVLQAQTNLIESCGAMTTEDIDVSDDKLARAVTPVTIRRFSSIESDVKFVDVEEETNEDIKEPELREEIRSPTVEFFYGPLPERVLNEIVQETKECFTEALQLLNACAMEIENNISQEISSRSDVEEFAESVASVHDPDDESVSEYFPIIDSEHPGLEIPCVVKDSNVRDSSSMETSITMNANDSLWDSNSIYSSSNASNQDASSSREVIQEMDKGETVGSLKANEIKLLTSDSSGVFTENSFATQTTKELQMKEASKEHLLLESLNFKDDTSESDISKLLEIEESAYVECSSDNVPVSICDSSDISPIEYSVEHAPENVLPLQKEIASNQDSIQSDLCQVERLSNIALKIVSEKDVTSSLPRNLTQLESVNISGKSKADKEYSSLLTSSATKIAESETEVKIVSECTDVLLGSTPTSQESFERNDVSQIIDIQSASTFKTDSDDVIESLEEGIKETIKRERVSDVPDKKTEETALQRHSIQKSESLNQESSSITQPEKSGSKYVGSEAEIDINNEQFERLEFLSFDAGLPDAPSDIVRYLFYDDSIQFEDDSNAKEESSISAHSVSFQEAIENTTGIIPNFDVNKENSELTAELLNIDSVSQSSSDTKDEDMETSSQIFVSMSDSSLEFQSIHSNTTDADHFESIYSTSESVEWFDIDSSKSAPAFQDEDFRDADALTESQSTTKDEQGSQSFQLGKNGDLPVAVAECDEITDISTHFTMTEDESDKFSDIDTDSLTNFDDDYFSVERNGHRQAELDDILAPESGNELYVSKNDSDDKDFSTFPDVQAKKANDFCEISRNLMVDAEKITISTDLNGNVAELQSRTLLDTVDESKVQNSELFQSETANLEIPPKADIQVDFKSLQCCAEEFVDMSHAEEPSSMQTQSHGTWQDAHSASLAKEPKISTMNIQHGTVESLWGDTSSNQGISHTKTNTDGTSVEISPNEVENTSPILCSEGDHSQKQTMSISSDSKSLEYFTEENIEFSQADESLSMRTQELDIWEDAQNASLSKEPKLSVTNIQQGTAESLWGHTSSSQDISYAETSPDGISDQISSPEGKNTSPIHCRDVDHSQQSTIDISSNSKSLESCTEEYIDFSQAEGFLKMQAQDHDIWKDAQSASFAKEAEISMPVVQQEAQHLGEMPLSQCISEYINSDSACTPNSSLRVENEFPIHCSEEQYSQQSISVPAQPVPGGENILMMSGSQSKTESGTHSDRYETKEIKSDSLPKELDPLPNLFSDREGTTCLPKLDSQEMFLSSDENVSAREQSGSLHPTQDTCSEITVCDSGFELPAVTEGTFDISTHYLLAENSDASPHHFSEIGTCTYDTLSLKETTSSGESTLSSVDIDSGKNISQEGSEKICHPAEVCTPAEGELSATTLSELKEEDSKNLEKSTMEFSSEIVETALIETCATRSDQSNILVSQTEYNGGVMKSEEKTVSEMSTKISSSAQSVIDGTGSSNDELIDATYHSLSGDSAESFDDESELSIREESNGLIHDPFSHIQTLPIQECSSYCAEDILGMAADKEVSQALSVTDDIETVFDRSSSFTFIDPISSGDDRTLDRTSEILTKPHSSETVHPQESFSFKDHCSGPSQTNVNQSIFSETSSPDPISKSINNQESFSFKDMWEEPSHELSIVSEKLPIISETSSELNIPLESFSFKDLWHPSSQEESPVSEKSATFDKTSPVTPSSQSCCLEETFSFKDMWNASSQEISETKDPVLAERSTIHTADTNELQNIFSFKDMWSESALEKSVEVDTFSSNRSSDIPIPKVNDFSQEICSFKDMWTQDLQETSHVHVAGVTDSGTILNPDSFVVQDSFSFKDMLPDSPPENSNVIEQEGHTATLTEILPVVPTSDSSSSHEPAFSFKNQVFITEKEEHKHSLFEILPEVPSEFSTSEEPEFSFRGMWADASEVQQKSELDLSAETVYSVPNKISEFFENSDLQASNTESVQDKEFSVLHAGVKNLETDALQKETAGELFICDTKLPVEPLESSSICTLPSSEVDIDKMKDIEEVAENEMLSCGTQKEAEINSATTYDTIVASLEHLSTSNELSNISDASTDVKSSGYDIGSTDEHFLHSEAESSCFHSAIENIDNASIVTTDEDFTDAPSRMTLTEDSEWWSDVDTDTSMGYEQLESEANDVVREKTPIGFEELIKPSADDNAKEKTPPKDNIKSQNSAFNAEKISIDNNRDSSIDKISEGDAVMNSQSLSVVESSQNSSDQQKEAVFKTLSLNLEASDNDGCITISSSDPLLDSSKLKKTENDQCGTIVQSMMDASQDSMSLERVSLEVCSQASATESAKYLDSKSEMELSPIKVEPTISEINLKHMSTDEMSVEGMHVTDSKAHVSSLGKRDSEASDLSLKISISSTENEYSLSELTLKQNECSTEKQELNVGVSLYTSVEDGSAFITKRQEAEVSEMSSTFETVSKEDSEKHSDFEEDSFRDMESDLNSTSRLEELSKSDYAVDNDINKGIVDKISSDTKDIGEVNNISDSKGEEIKLDSAKISEILPLDESKKALSVSLADIVESTELQFPGYQTSEYMLENFEDIKPISEQAVIIDSYTSADSDAAVTKVHELSSSVSLEQTGVSENWLEAETEYSISEFEDEAVSLSEKGMITPDLLDVKDCSEERFNMHDSLQISTDNEAEASASFYSESESSDHVSDTCADISLQGATTEGSDRWSDIEDDGQYESVRSIEARDLLCGNGVDLQKTIQDYVESQSRFIEDSQSNKNIQAKPVMVPEIISESKSPESLLEKEKQEINKVVKLTQGDIKTDSLQTLEKHVESMKSEDSDAKIQKQHELVPCSGMSDDDFTSVTPLEPTVEESDKWSDISDDTSIEEMLDSSRSLSMTVDDLSKLGLDVEHFAENSLSTVKESDQDNIDFRLDRETEKFDEANTVSERLTKKVKPFEEEQTLIAADDIPNNKTSIPAAEILEAVVGTKPSDIDFSNIYSLSPSEGEETHGDFEMESIGLSPVYEGEEENVQESVDLDENLQEDLDLEENLQECLDLNDNETEETDDYYPDESLPYILTDDELVYPLQYDNWMEESFDLKEYGIDAVFTGSEIDVHGAGLNVDDIQRAIDLNISNFNEAIESFAEEQNLNTESFKTMSNHSPSKTTDKEHDSWSTADADSIEDDLAEHDNVIAKIDEILAEDFAYDPIDYYGEERNAFTPEQRNECSPDVQSSITPELTFQSNNEYDTSHNAFSIKKRESLSKLEQQLSAPEEANILMPTKTDDTYESKMESTAVEDNVVVKLDSKLLLKEEDADFTLLVKEEKKVSSEEVKEATDSLPTIDIVASVYELFSDDSTKIKSDKVLKEKTQLEHSNEKASKDDTVEKKIEEKCKDDKRHGDSKLEKVIESTSTDAREITPVDSKQRKDDKKIQQRDKDLEKEYWKPLAEDTEKSKIEEEMKEKEHQKDSKITEEQKEESLSECTPTKGLEKNLADKRHRGDSTSENESEVSRAEKGNKAEKESVQKKKSKLDRKIDSDNKPTEIKKLEAQLQDHLVANNEKSKVDETKSKVDETKPKVDETKSKVDSKSEVTELKKISGKTASDNLVKEIESKPQEENRIQSTKLEKDYVVCKSSSSENTKLTSEDSVSKISSENFKDKSTPKDSIESVIVPVKDTSELAATGTTEPVKTKKDIPDIDANVKQEILEKETDHISIKDRVRKSSKGSSKDEVSPSILTNESEVNRKPDIPIKKKKSISKGEHADDSEKVITPTSPEEVTKTESKPDIPEKAKRKSISKTEPKPDDKNVPALPPKTLKRDSSSESISSSIFLSSSSESLSADESAPVKADIPPNKDEDVASDAPEVPSRRARVTPVVRRRRRESSEEETSTSSNPPSTEFRRRRRRDSADVSVSSSETSRSSVKSNQLPPEKAMYLCMKRTSIDERMVKLQNEGKCNSKEAAFIAAKLIEMQFEEEDALLASRQCNSVYHAVKFLTQLCELCHCRFPINLMASMIDCSHRACKDCLKAHFTSLIYDRSMFTLLCPVCHKPDVTDQNIQEYFNHLDMMLRNILDSNVYDLFQRKLRDEVLTKDPNFHWCSQCSSGFIASPRLKKLYCPDCSAITCASCHQTWELEHEGVHCERFQQWKDMHTPEPPPAGLVKYLTDRGITCPSCGLVYSQACGGCMIYKCSHCSFEFCGFCSRPYTRGKDCGNKSCEGRGIHAHHPYTCLFFLRDKDASELQVLLEEESVTFLTIPPKDQIVKSRCQVREQKHSHGSITEDRCGRDIVPYCAGLCRTHYYEYLCELLREKKINPLPVMTTQELQFMLRKSRVQVPERVKGETNDEYYNRLTKTVSSILS